MLEETNKSGFVCELTGKITLDSSGGERIRYGVSHIWQ